jgi:hypothetical protein
VVIGITSPGDDAGHPRTGSGQIGPLPEVMVAHVAALGRPPLPAIFGKRRIYWPLG